LERPLLENVKAALMYTLRGLDVLVVVFPIFVFVRWLKQRPSDAVAPVLALPVEVLVNGVATEEEEKKV
jgi:hypothetical protein